MTAQLLDLLTKDHGKIRALAQELRRATYASQPEEDRCFEIFRVLKATVVAHAKGEEFALYSLVEQPHSNLEAELQHFAYEGYEEHDLIDFLMKEMSTSEDINPQWRAQVTVLSEMLERHLNDEERNFFPKIQKLLTEKVAADLAEAYAKERDVIFAKRIGARPAFSPAPHVHH